MTQAFSLKNVKKEYKGFALDMKDLSLERGYVMGLVGRNGAGKSTAIKILMNLVYPDQGEVQVLGMRHPEDQLEIKRRVGYVSDEPVFYENMTVGWMADLVKRYYPTWDEVLHTRYAQKFRLDPGKKVKELSRGMKVKLGLMLALSHRPEFLILDEPTSGIDPVIRNELLGEILDVVADERRTVLLSSHITPDVEKVADYIAIIHGGRVITCRDKEDLLDSWRKVTGRLGGEPAATLDRIAPMFQDIRTDGNAFSGVTGSFSAQWLSDLEKRGATDPKSMGCTLDEILVSLVGKEE